MPRTTTTNGITTVENDDVADDDEGEPVSALALRSRQDRPEEFCWGCEHCVGAAQTDDVRRLEEYWAKIRVMSFKARCANLSQYHYEHFVVPFGGKTPRWSPKMVELHFVHHVDDEETYFYFKERRYSALEKAANDMIFRGNTKVDHEMAKTAVLLGKMAEQSRKRLREIRTGTTN